jgi:hypothetical protein
MIARKNENGNYTILDEEGFPVTRIDANVYPVGSELSAKYEHPEGIELTLEDVEKLNIEIC